MSSVTRKLPPLELESYQVGLNGNSNHTELNGTAIEAGQVPKPKKEKIKIKQYQPRVEVADAEAELERLAAKRSLQARWRSWLIFSLFMRFFFEHLLLNWGRRLLGNAWAEQREVALWRSEAIRFRERAIQLGGLLIKLGQFMSVRVDLLPKIVTDELSKLQDEVPSVPFEQIHAEITEQFGKPLEEVFPQFETQAIAAASLGQVHRATLPGGEVVAVKVMRPGIEEIIETDLEAVRDVVSWAVRVMKAAQKIDLAAIYEELTRVVHQELDYIQEGHNAEEFARNFANNPRVRIPRIYWEYTRPRVLTLEFLNGIKINNFAAIDEAGMDRNQIATVIANAYLQMVAVDGIFHADPHPGNVLVQPGPYPGAPATVVLLDFGMVGRVTPQHRASLRKVLTGVMRREPDEVIEGSLELGFLRKGIDLSPLRRALDIIFERYYDNFIQVKKLDDTVLLLAAELRELLYREPFQIPAEFTFMGRAGVTMTGICLGLNPKFNLLGAIEPYARRLMLEQPGATGTVLVQTLMQGVGQLLGGLGVAPGKQVQKSLKKVEEGDARIRLELAELNRRVRRQDKAIARLSLSILMAALLISGTLLIIFGIGWLGVLSYLATAGLGIPFLRTWIYNEPPPMPVIVKKE